MLGHAPSTGPVDCPEQEGLYAASGRPGWAIQTSPVPVDDGPPNAFFSPNAAMSACASPCLGARQVPRRLWQPDHEAQKCSLLACGKSFGSWLNTRKHHCRQCGRVVCGSCSARMKMLLPPKGERGPPRNVRVCEACFLSHETFSFERTASAGYLCGSPGSMGSASSMDSFSSSARELASPPAPVRMLARLKESSSSPAILQQFQKVLSIKMDGTISDDRPGAGLDAAAAAQSLEVVSAAETQSPDSPSSDSKSCRGTSSPMRVPRGLPEDLAEVVQAPQDDGAAEHLLQDLAPADVRRKEWIASVQKKFGADPHYHAMLKYEPQALKALITCTMAP